MEENPVTRLTITLLGAGSIKAGTAPDLESISHMISRAKKKIKGKQKFVQVRDEFGHVLGFEPVKKKKR